MTHKREGGGRAVCQRWEGREIPLNPKPETRNQAASDMSGTPIPGKHWLEVLFFFFFFFTLVTGPRRSWSLKLGDTRVSAGPRTATEEGGGAMSPAGRSNFVVVPRDCATVEGAVPRRARM